MIFLISGENSSGKSVFAEDLITSLSGSPVYIATMICSSEDNEERILKHQLRRKGRGFKDVEEPLDLRRVPVRREDPVLLEDLSNLLANVMFQAGGDGSSVLRQIEDLEKRCSRLFIVTISGLDPSPYDGETAGYINELNRLNAAVVKISKVHVEMESGRPVYLKGTPEDVH